MSKVLAVDPGKTTGWALAEFDTQATPVSGQDDAMPFLELAEAWAERNGPGLTLVVEKFTITAATLKKTRETDALDVIGALRWFSHRYNCPMVLQTPAEAKSFATDGRLRAVGLWVPGQDHARDACRHLLLHAVRNGLIRPEDVVDAAS